MRVLKKKNRLIWQRDKLNEILAEKEDGKIEQLENSGVPWNTFIESIEFYFGWQIK